MKIFVVVSYILLCNTVLTLSPAPIIHVDLSLPPELRFKESVEYVLNNKGWEHSFGPMFAFHNESLFNKLNTSVLYDCAATLNKYYPENAAELYGISKAFINRGYYVSFEYLAGWAYFHELSHTTDVVRRDCSAAVVRGSDGTIYHGRNMDHEPAKYLRNITIHHKFYNKGLFVGQTADWYWFSGGMMSAMTVCGERLSLQENWRIENLPLSEILDRIIRQHYYPQKFLFRNILTASCSALRFRYVDAVNMIYNIPFAVGMYIIVGGQGGEASILTLAANGKLPVIHMGNNTLFPPWLLAQSNYDPWDQDPDYDPRRTLIVDSLIKFGDDAASSDAVLATMVTQPVGDPDDTDFIIIMSPTTGSFHTYIYEL